MYYFVTASKDSTIYNTTTKCKKPEYLSEEDILKLKV